MVSTTLFSWFNVHNYDHENVDSSRTQTLQERNNSVEKPLLSFDWNLNKHFQAKSKDDLRIIGDNDKQEWF